MERWFYLHRFGLSKLRLKSSRQSPVLSHKHTKYQQIRNRKEFTIKKTSCNNFTRYMVFCLYMATIVSGLLFSDVEQVIGKLSNLQQNEPSLIFFTQSNFLYNHMV